MGKLPQTYRQPFTQDSLELLSLMQVVVMAGGANDFVLGSPPSLEDWRSTYLTFLQNVSHAYILFCAKK